ncbi:unnamed protein product [Gongylonema pulchrum]|uniref:RNase H domain-containing protein n=1 Tax=Gongylonema pulchrum TaxID=637853 RepID=A0A183EGX9_9BILA|nr:unnamed protein product [Gongylonema pulchrum]
MESIIRTGLIKAMENCDSGTNSSISNELVLVRCVSNCLRLKRAHTNGVDRTLNQGVADHVFQLNQPLGRAKPPQRKDRSYLFHVTMLKSSYYTWPVKKA